MKAVNNLIQLSEINFISLMANNISEYITVNPGEK